MATMKTVFKWQKRRIIDSIINGEVVALPTDTVFGLACNTRDEDSYDKLLAVKGRNPQKPVAILISDPKQIEMYAHMNDMGLDLMGNWPGPLTMVFKKKVTYSHRHYDGNDMGIGFRMPSDKWLLSIIERTGPIFVTSANISGKPPLDKWADIKNELPDIELLVRKDSSRNLPSTVVDLTKQKPRVLREGEVVI